MVKIRKKKKNIWKADCEAPWPAPAKACEEQRKFNCIWCLGNKLWPPQYHTGLPTVTAPATLVPPGLLWATKGEQEATTI